MSPNKNIALCKVAPPFTGLGDEPSLRRALLFNDMRKRKLSRDGLRKCFRCKQIFELNISNFYPSKQGDDCGFVYECKPCCLIRSREYKKKRRLKLRFTILQRDNFTCQYCGRKAPDVVLHLDHIFPNSKGGLLVEENLITACSDCNIGKQDIVLNEHSKTGD